MSQIQNHPNKLGCLIRTRDKEGDIKTYKQIAFVITSGKRYFAFVEFSKNGTTIYIYPLAFLKSMINLERDADELAALALIMAGITIVTTSVFGALFFGATMEMEVIEKIGGWMFILPTAYLFGKSRPNEK